MEKKKIKDFTIGEMAKICEKYTKEFGFNRCAKCPFHNCNIPYLSKYLDYKIGVEDESSK